MKIKMEDYNYFYTYPFGWDKVFIFYAINTIVIFLFHKIKKMILSKKSLLLDLIYLSGVFFIGFLYLIIFYYGEKSYLGNLFIEEGGRNKNIITLGSFILMLYVTIFYSPKIKR